jgi:hypothetical protein
MMRGWWSNSEIPDGAEAYSVHRKSVDRQVLWIFLGLGLVETGALHVILRHWSPVIAWTLSGLGILALLSILSTIRAMQVRPVLLTSTGITLSLGSIRSVHVPIASVSEVARCSGSIRKARTVFRTSLMEPPNVLMKLAAPAQARARYGGFRPVTSIAAFLDMPDAFIAAVEMRRLAAHAKS